MIKPSGCEGKLDWQSRALLPQSETKSLYKKMILWNRSRDGGWYRHLGVANGSAGSASILAFIRHRLTDQWSQTQPILYYAQLTQPPLVMLQQPAKAFTANDLAPVSRVLRHPEERHIADFLARSFFGIVREELRDNMIEMLLANNHELIPTLLLKRLYK